MTTGFTPVANGALVNIDDINRYIEPINDLESGATYYAVDTGTADNYEVALTPAATAYTAGMLVRFKAANTSTSAGSTLDVNSLGTKAIKKADGTSLGADDIRSSMVVEVVYDGTHFQLLNPGTAGGGGGGVTGFLKVLQDIYGAISEGSWDQHYSDGDWHGLLYGRSGADSAWVDATNAVYTVPTGKKAVIARYSADSGVAFVGHGGYVEGRVRNTTDSTDVVASSYFRDRGVGGDFWGGGALNEVAAGKTMKLGIYLKNDTTRAGAVWCIFRVVNA